MTRRSASAWAIAAVVAAVAPPATADVSKCVAATVHAQALRRDGKFAAARGELQNCGVPSCPELVRDDCAARLDDLERAQPTVLFDVRDGDGRDRVGVQVTLDGQPLAERLEGKPLRVDPGEHTFVFSVEGQAPVTQAFVLREGEKDRRERIVIGAPASQPAPPPTAPVASPVAPAAEPPTSGLGTRRIAGIALGGAGVAGLGLGTVFGLLASSAWSNAKSACGGDIGHCADVPSATSYKSTTQTDGTISTIGFAAGGALLVAGAVLFLLPVHAETPAAAGLKVVPAVGQTQQGLLVSGTF